MSTIGTQKHIVVSLYQAIELLYNDSGEEKATKNKIKGSMFKPGWVGVIEGTQGQSPFFTRG